MNDLNREAYLSSVETIQDPETAKLANMSLFWWDKHYLWSQQSSVVLSNDQDEHLSYIFYHVDRDNQYMTIHDIFTPLEQQRKGYAHELLKMVFDLAIANNVSRFKMTTTSKSLDFFLTMGFIYWGVNNAGDYFCDLPVPGEGLDSMEGMVNASDTQSLIGKSLTSIHTKVKGHNLKLTTDQTAIYENDLVKMGEHYRLQGLLDIKK